MFSTSVFLEKIFSGQVESSYDIMQKMFERKSKILPLQSGKAFKLPNFKNLEKSANCSSGQEEGNFKNPAGFFFSARVRKFFAWSPKT